MTIDYSLLRVYTEYPHKGLSVTFRFYEDPPSISGGAGGWQGSPRPLGNPITAWKGPSDPYSMTLSLIMDCWADGTKGGRAPDIETDCRNLEKMSGALTAYVGQPPLLILDAGGALQNDVINRPSLRWVISDSPTYSDVQRNAQGRRVRQVVSVPFMRYSAYDALTRHRSTVSAQPLNTFTASESVSTFKIAAGRYLKHSGGTRWATRLANLNGARDPNASLLPGRVYRLPTTEELKQWERNPRR